MDAVRLIEDFRARGIRLIPEPPKLVVEPASRLTDADRQAIRALKPALMELLSPERSVGIIDPAAAASMLVQLRATLIRVESIADLAPASMRERIADLVAEIGPAISILMMHGNSAAVRVALLDLERSAHDIAIGRGQL